MKKLHYLFFFIASFFSIIASAQTADEILSKHFDAEGGKDKVSQINSIYMQNSVNVMGNESASETIILNGKGYKNESDFNGQKLIQSYTDKGGWTINPFAGSPDAAPLSDDEYKTVKDMIYVEGPLLNYAAKGYKAELLGKDGNDFKIKFTSPENIVLTYYFDATTYLTTKRVTTGVMQGQNIEITTTYADYRKTDYGYMMPYKTDVDFGQFQLTINVTKVEINKEIDPKVFEMPAK